MYESIDANCINLISTMYYRFDWDQIETADGVYDWSEVDYYINMAKKRNKKIAFGVMNASTSANSAYCTPQWVFEKGAQYTIVTNEYGNPQYYPVWDDPIYLEEMNQFIQAFGERYDGNENIAYIDIRAYGNWGEQHNYLLNSTDITAHQLRNLYIQPYIDNFPNTLLVNPWGVNDFNDTYKWAIDNGVSIRRDGIMENNNEFVRGLEIFQYAAGKLPTMFEYHEAYRNKIEDPNVEELNMEYLWQYILEWKPTYIEMLPELYQKEPEWVERIANKVGYYFKFTGGEYESDITNSENTTVKIDFLNEGVSRLFEPCTVYIGILDEYDNLVKKIKTNIDAQSWLPNITKQENISISYSGIKNGNYKLAIGLFLDENDDNPKYLIANNGRTDENWYPIGNVKVKNIEVSDIGDLDCDCNITAFDAYLALKYSVENDLEQIIISVADIDEDRMVTAFDAYKILITSTEWKDDEDDNYLNNRIYIDKNGTTIAKKQGVSEPWIPTSNTEILNNNIEDGLVIKDEKGNEWVWVEVPKTVTANTKTDAAIEACLKNYVSTIYTRPGGYSDKYSSGKGLTEEEYLEKKSEMLKSIKHNGGFYIGRYEAGVEGRNLITKFYDQYGNELTDLSNGYYIYSGTWDEKTPGKTVINNYSAPYLWVNNEQAENLAEELSTGNATSSLPFGIQWDLTLKYIKENSDVTETELSSNSTGWGNYLNSEFISKSDSGYSPDYGISWRIGAYTKSAYREMCFATGASNDFAKNNIYDLAGNVFEWTLERYADSNVTGVVRGGGYGDNGYMKPAFSRSYKLVDSSDLDLGFRAVLY